MFSLAYNLPTTTSNSSKFRRKRYVQTKWIKITSKKVSRNTVDISMKEITLKKHVEAWWIFRPSKWHQKKYVEATWIFRASKIHRAKYVETTWIFRPPKLRRKKYVETTWMFQSAKLHQKSIWKWRGNSSKYSRRIYVDLTWNARWVLVYF